MIKNTCKLFTIASNKILIIEIGMSFNIDALFEGNFLTASIIWSLDIDLKEKLSPL